MPVEILKDDCFRYLLQAQNIFSSSQGPIFFLQGPERNIGQKERTIEPKSKYTQTEKCVGQAGAEGKGGQGRNAKASLRAHKPDKLKIVSKVFLVQGCIQISSLQVTSGELQLQTISVYFLSDFIETYSIIGKKSVRLKPLNQLVEFLVKMSFGSNRLTF